MRWNSSYVYMKVRRNKGQTACESLYHVNNCHNLNNYNKKSHRGQLNSGAQLKFKRQVANVFHTAGNFTWFCDLAPSTLYIHVHIVPQKMTIGIWVSIAKEPFMESEKSNQIMKLWLFFYNSVKPHLIWPSGHKEIWIFVS